MSKWRVEQYGLRWQVMNGRSAGAGIFENSNDAHAHCDYLNVLEAENEALVAENAALKIAIRSAAHACGVTNAYAAPPPASDDLLVSLVAETAALKAALSHAYDSLREIRDRQVDNHQVLQPLIDYLESAR